jgi:tetratricopeptide (TPR) repeat protein
MFTSSAGAAPPPVATNRAPTDNARALALYKDSTKAYQEDRFQDAVNLLTEAYSLQQEPVILFNLARAYEGLGDLESAVESYSRYLEREPTTPDRKSIEQRIATLGKLIEARKALERQRDEERVRAEEARKAAEEAQRRAALEEEQRHGAGPWPWVVAGAGVAGVGVGVVFGVLSHNRYESAVGDAYRGPAQSDYSAAQTNANVANGAFIAGGVLVAAGAIWLLVDRLTTHETTRAQQLPSSARRPAAGLILCF